MGRSLTLSETNRGGDYVDVLDYLYDTEHGGKFKYGSSVRAIAQIIRKSRDYREWQKRQEAGQKSKR